MDRAIAASKKKNDQVDARKIAGLLRCELLSDRAPRVPRTAAQRPLLRIGRTTAERIAQDRELLRAVRRGTHFDRDPEAFAHLRTTQSTSPDG